MSNKFAHQFTSDDDDDDDNNNEEIENIPDNGAQETEINIKDFISERISKNEIDNFNSVIHSIQLQIKNLGEILHFEILTKEIPSYLSQLLGFDSSPTLLIIDLEFGAEGQFIKSTCTNPKYGQKLPCYCLLSEKIESFFKAGYQPGPLDKFPNSNSSPTSFQGPYPKYRFVWLINDILSCFYLMIDHCSICGRKLQHKFFKPTYCGDPQCKTQFIGLETGTSVWTEIHRDNYTADLLISLFSAAIGTHFLRDKAAIIGYLQQQTDITQQRKLLSFCETLPSMKDLENCENDDGIKAKIGPENFEILKAILFDNDSGLIHLPDELKNKKLTQEHHFLQLTTNQDKELKFQEEKKIFNSMMLWHGSLGERWYSIFKNSLKNYSGTSEMRVGQVYGPGIYFAPTCATSYGYSSIVQNRYKNSLFGSFYVIGFVEVAKRFNQQKPLKDHGRCFTMEDEDGVVVRYLLVSKNNNYSIDSRDTQTQQFQLPTIDDIFNYFEKENSKK